MKYILSAKEMAAADKFTIKNHKTTSLKLMEKAAKEIAEEVDNRYKNSRILVVCGTGNNGGDGYAAARLLKERGHTVICYKLEGQMSEECKFNLEKFDGEIINSIDHTMKFDVIIDAIFGIGLSRDIKGEHLAVIDYINSCDAFKISIDIPSGISAESGVVLGGAVLADLTIILGEYKLGNYLNNGIDYSKEIILKNIGIKLPDNNYAVRYENNEIKKFFPKRKRNVNKGDFGRCSLIAGSYEYSGAAIISSNALASLKLGSGYSNICIPMSLINVFAGLVPECTITLLKDKIGELEFDKLMLKKIISVSQAICIGMGVKCSQDLYKTIEYLLKNFKGSLLIDADGLNALSEYGTDILKQKKCKVILTPHIKEFSRLTNIPIENIFKDSVNIAKDYAKEFDVTLVLKSAVSIITNGEKTAINIRGTSGMAKGGSGDVLSGVIGGLLARGLSCFDAAVSGAYVFGFAGELAAAEGNEYSMVASDIIKKIPTAINIICE
jgi:NAD(P)H-hydrate epimerase